jgi:hypothetical protein
MTMGYVIAAVACLVIAQIGGIVCLRAKTELTGSLFVIIMLLASAGLGYTGLRHLLLH